MACRPMNSALSAMVYSPDGRCIAGSSNGLVSFFPGKKQHAIYPPGAQISTVYINDVPYTSTSNPDEIKTISLSHRQNTFSFDFHPSPFSMRMNAVLNTSWKAMMKPGSKAGRHIIPVIVKSLPGIMFSIFV